MEAVATGVDLGTYWVRVQFDNGQGFLYKWETGRRYSKGTEEYKPLDSDDIPPAWSSDAEALEAIRWQFLEGNFSCDCNRLLFLARSRQEDDPEEVPCGDTLRIQTLTVIRPDGVAVILCPDSFDL